MSEIRPTEPVPVMRPRNPLQPNIGSDKPPSDAVKAAPYNWGEFLLPHVVSFQGIVSTVSRIYRYYDEAMKHSFDNARFMRNDLMVMEPVEQRRRACALLNWHIEVDDEKDPVQKELAESLTKLLKAIPNFLKFREVLLDAVWYGKNAAQWRWGWKKVRGIEAANGHYGNLCITDWKPLHGDKIVFRYDDGLREYDPNQVGIRVGAGYTAGDKGIQGRMSAGGTRKVEACDYGLAYFLEPWERKLLAIHKHMIEDGEYEDPQSAGKIHGVGIRSRIYWSWYMKQELHAWMMEFLERNAAGIEIWYYPMGNPEAEAKTRQAAQERIGNARNVILMPRPVDEAGTPFGVEMVPPNMGGADTVERILTEYFGDQIMRYVLGQTMTNKAQSAGLGSDLPQVQLGTYLQIIRYDAINLGETMTTDVVEPMRDLNYPQHRDIPVRFVVDTESEDLESKLSAWKQAYEVGLKTKASDWYRIIGASKPEEEDDVIENPATKQQDRLYEQWQMNKQAEASGQLPPGTADAQMQGGGAHVQGGLGEEGGAPPASVGGPGAGGAAEQPPELPPIDAGQEGYARGGQPDKYEQPHGGTYDTGSGAGTIPASAITKGTIHELEHTKNHNVARSIALDHLRERPDYYEVLDRAMAQPPTIPIENSEREKLAKYSLADSIKTAADQTDTNPSDEQKQAGNYRKGKVRIQGLEIAIENPAGSTRRGKGWETTMANHYGYIKTQVSEADGDHVDVFIGPHPESEIVYVVDQNKAPTWSHFDEHKVMLGFTSEAKAKQAYLANYSPGWQGFSAITPMTMPQFKGWLDKGLTGERAEGQALKYSKQSSGGPLPGGQGHDATHGCTCAAGRCAFHEDYAKRKPAAGQAGMFDEDKHPRGQPENKGQFAEKEQASGGPAGGEEKPEKAEPLPGQKDIFGGVEPAKPKPVWEMSWAEWFETPKGKKQKAEMQAEQDWRDWEQSEEQQKAHDALMQSSGRYRTLEDKSGKISNQVLQERDDFPDDPIAEDYGPEFAQLARESDKMTIQYAVDQGWHVPQTVMDRFGVSAKPAAAAPKQSQSAMFHGLKDLPGQQDLFNADKGAGETQPAAGYKLVKGSGKGWPDDVNLSELPAMAKQQLGDRFHDVRLAIYGGGAQVEVRKRNSGMNGYTVGIAATYPVAADDVEKVREALKEPSRGKQSTDPAPAEERPDQAEAKPAPAPAAKEAGANLKGNHKDWFDKLVPALEKQVSNEKDARRKGMIARSIMHGEPPEVQKALLEHLATFDPEAHAWMKANPPKFRYSRLFDPGLMHQRLMERYYRQSPPEALDAWWAGGAGSIVVIQDSKPIRYTRGTRGSVTVEPVT